MAGLGTIFVELDLDTKEFTRKEKQILEGARKTALGVEENFRILGIKSNGMYEAMRQQAQNAFNQIANSGKNSAQEIQRAQEALHNRLKQLNNEQLGIHQTTNKSILDQASSWGIYATKAYLAYKAVQAITTVFTAGFKAVEDYQTSVASIASVMASMSERGKTDIAGAYKEAYAYSEKLVAKIEEWDAKTILTGKQLTSMVETLIQGGQQVDINNKKHEESVIALGNAIAVITKGQNIEIQLRQEIRGLLDGEVKATNRLATMLDNQLGGTLKEHIKLWEAQGTRLENVGSLLKGFTEGAKDLENTWGAISSTMETIANKILREAFLPLYQDIVQMAKALSTEIVKGDTVMQSLKDTLKEGIWKTWTAIKSIVESVIPLWEIMGPIVKVWAGATITALDTLAKILTVIPVITERIGAMAASWKEVVMMVGSYGQALYYAATGQMKKAWEAVEAGKAHWNKAGDNIGKAFASGFVLQAQARLGDYAGEARKELESLERQFAVTGGPPKLAGSKGKTDAAAAKEAQAAMKQAQADAEAMRRALEELNVMVGRTESELSGKLAAIEKRYADMREKLKGNAEALVILEQWKADAIAKVYAEEDKATVKYFDDATKNYNAGFNALAREIEAGVKLTQAHLKKMGVKSEDEQSAQNADDAIKEMQRFVTVGSELGDQWRTQQAQANDTFFGGLKAGWEETVKHQKSAADMGKAVWRDFSDSIKATMAENVDAFIHQDADIAKIIEQDRDYLDTKYNRDISRLQAMAAARSADARQQMSDADFVKQRKDELDQQYLESKQAIVDKEKDLEKSKLTLQQSLGDQMTNLAGEISKKMYNAAIDKIIGIIGALIGEAMGGAAASGSLKGGVVGALTEMGIFMATGIGSMMLGKAAADKFKAEGGWVASHPMGGWIQEGSGTRDDVFLGMTPGVRHWGMGGEFVINKESAAKHAGLLQTINADRGHDEGGPITDWEPMADMLIGGTVASAIWGFFTKGGPWGALAEAIAFNIKAVGGAFLGKIVSEQFNAAGGEIQQTDRFSFIDPFGILPGGSNSPIPNIPWITSPPEGLPDPLAALRFITDPEESLELIKEVIREPYKQIAKDLLTPGINWSSPIDGVNSGLQLLEKVFKKMAGIKHSGGVIGADERMILAETGEGIVSRAGMENLGRLNLGYQEGGEIDPTLLASRAAIGAPQWTSRWNTGLPEDEPYFQAEMAIRQKEIELIKALGRESEALAMERWDELQAMDASLRGIQEAIWWEEDRAKTQAYWADIAESQLEAGKKARSMEIELMKLQGKEEEALTLERSEALKELSKGYFQDMQKLIWATEDATKAEEELTKAREEEAAAAVTQRVRYMDLHERLLKAQGKDEELLFYQRAREATEMERSGDSYSASMLEQIYAAEDATKAQEELTKAQQDAASKLEAALGKIRMEDFSTSYEYRLAVGLTKVRGYDSGGYHPGGLRIVGERGPELEWTGPSRIYSNGESGGLVSNAEVVRAIRELRDDLVSLGIQTVVNTGGTTKVIKKWDGIGLPDSQSNLTSFGN